MSNCSARCFTTIRGTSVGTVRNVPRKRTAGCKKTFSYKMTGSRMDRPGWNQLMDYVRPGDALVVTELSRMTRDKFAQI